MTTPFAGFATGSLIGKVCLRAPESRPSAREAQADRIEGGREELGTDEQASVSEAQIAVHWREEEYYQPPAKFIAQANAADPDILERFSEQHFPDCFKEYADLLSWDTGSE